MKKKQIIGRKRSQCLCIILINKLKYSKNEKNRRTSTKLPNKDGIAQSEDSEPNIRNGMDKKMKGNEKKTISMRGRSCDKT